MKFHHVGILVEDLIHSSIEYKNLGFTVCKNSYNIQSQKVKVRFVKNKGGGFIELVQC